MPQKFCNQQSYLFNNDSSILSAIVPKFGTHIFFGVRNSKLMLKNERNKRIRYYCKVHSNLDDKSISGPPVIKISISEKVQYYRFKLFPKYHQTSGNTCTKNKCFFLALVDTRF